MKVFKTTDIKIASYIKAKSIDVDSVEWVGDRAKFCFDSPYAEDLAMEYMRGGDAVASKLFWAFDELKSVIYNREAVNE